MPDTAINTNETKCESVAIVPTLNVISETGSPAALQPVDSTACLLPQANRLHPADSLVKTSSQSSLDSNIKYDDNIDMMPLMPIDPKCAKLKMRKRRFLNNDPVPLLAESVHKPSDESWYTVALQVLFPFFMAGFGMVGAGVFLDKVTHWPLYVNIKAIFTLIPALLGLKGNLEMTLASRFSTQVNLGKIKDKPTILSAVLGNFALTQAQAIVVGFLASVGAITLKYFTENFYKKSTTPEIDLANSLVLIAGCMSTASFASLVLAGLMMLIIILSKRININPDNIATPIAASLGDLVTLVILSYLCTFLYEIKPQLWLHWTVVVVFLILIPVFIYYSYHNEFVSDVLKNGWTPILLAMIISR
ncbi:solute carrier family 41 member 1-like [Brachionus plicatilis]|uniref:Solute carrier family 41 member 1-like n=1 Tax=Brachionus plicatilis TaxID=10195 RepID=A0A3M7P5K6_BRAPC|nr:solute carrier family 41 member 1-like [Brachionus plicatilis]